LAKTSLKQKKSYFNPSFGILYVYKSLYKAYISKPIIEQTPNILKIEYSYGYGISYGFSSVIVWQLFWFFPSVCNQLLWFFSVSRLVHMHLF